VQHIESRHPSLLADRSDRRGNGRVRLTDFQLVNRDGKFTGEIMAGEEVVLKLRIKAIAPEVLNVEVQVEFYDMYGQLCFMVNSGVVGKDIKSLQGECYLECRVAKFPLNTQHYFVNVTLFESRHIADEIKNLVSFEVVPGRFYDSGLLPGTGKGFLVDYSWTTT
jgi:lipopolysaccharide transport system ATP-binding protein